MIAFPIAKINIGLYVTEKRADGYHNLETIFYPVAWRDVLEILPAPSFQFKSYGLPIEGKADHNLCVKAYRLLAQDFEIPPVSIHLLKQIPMGAGLGGGSSDGATTLSLLNDRFSLGLSVDQLRSYALQLGSDCPFFINPQPSLAYGRGEILKPIEVPQLENGAFFLVNPMIHLSTPGAFQQIQPQPAAFDLKTLPALPLANWKETIRNQFEAAAVQQHPIIGECIQNLYRQGAKYAAMTGSGSTVFGIFEASALRPTGFPTHWPQRWIG